MTWVLEESLVDEMVVRKHTYQFVRAPQIMEYVVADPDCRRSMLLSDVMIEGLSGANYETGSNVEEIDGTQ